MSCIHEFELSKTTFQQIPSLFPPLKQQANNRINAKNLHIVIATFFYIIIIIIIIIIKQHIFLILQEMQEECSKQPQA